MSKPSADAGEGSLIKLWLRKQRVESPALTCELDTLTPLRSSRVWLGHGILCGANVALLYGKYEQFCYAARSNVKWMLRKSSKI